METERDEKTAAESDAYLRQSVAIADVEDAIEEALRVGVSAREIRKLVKEVVEYHSQGDRNI